MYSVHDRVLDTDSIVMEKHIRFIEKLDGKTNPAKILRGYTKQERDRYLSWLEAEGLIRIEKNIIARFPVSMENNLKIQKVAYILNLLLMFSFLICLMIGLKLIGRQIYDFRIFEYLDMYLGSYYLPGYIVGILLGIVLHELGHAIATIAYGGTVFEFGVMFNVFLAAYTAINTNEITRKLRKIQIDLAGVEFNFLLTGIALIIMVLAADSSGICAGIVLANLTLGVINILFIDGVDGLHVIEQILGEDDILDSSNKAILKAIRRNKFKYDENDKIKLVAASIFSLTRLIYPAILIFNIVVIFF